MVFLEKVFDITIETIIVINIDQYWY